jgi:hypothetical protein
MVLMLMSVYATVNASEEDGLPGMALLEFLAEWETADGQWIDPVELDDPDDPAVDDAALEVPHD